MSLPQTTLLALHYQNDVLHPEGRIRVGLGARSERREPLLAAARALLAGARARGYPIVHVRIAFRPDQADLIANCPLFRNVAALRAMEEGSWGAQFFEGLEPDAASAREFVLTHQRVNAFYGTPLDAILRVTGARRLIVAGVATYSVVESTVRHAADVGFSIHVAADACAAAEPAVHEASLATMRLLAEVGDVAAALAQATGEGA